MLSIDSRVLLTGAGGFIGAAVCKKLMEQGYYVRATSRTSITQGNENLSINLKGSLPESLCIGIDTIFHLAGKAHALAENRQDEAEYHKINTEGTRKLLEAAKLAKVQRFIYFSSVKAVGDSLQQPMNEAYFEPADTAYGTSKYAAELLVLHGGFIPHPVVIRPCMVYGNTDKGNLPKMINAIRRGLFPPIPEFNNRRSMVYVEDLVEAALLVAGNTDSVGQIYIVSDEQSYSTREIYNWIRTELGLSPLKCSLPLSILKSLAKIGDIISLTGRRFIFDSDALQKLSGSAYYSSAKISTELGFRPKYTLQQVLPDIIRYLSSHRDN